MKVQVPGDMNDRLIRALTDNEGSFLNDEHGYQTGWQDAIDYCNEQLASLPPTKRPFLSDLEIEDEVKDFGYAEDRELYRTAARWARDKYEAAFVADVPSVEPKWQPVVGQLVAAWGHNYHKEDNFKTVVGIYQAQKSHDGYHIIKGFNDENDFYRSHVAALENLDEIGKPPSYFIDRGRATV